MKPRIYRYGKNGRVEGFQARVKWTRHKRNGQIETASDSKYYSFAKCGSKAAALARAERWLKQHDRARGKGRKRAQKPALRVIRGGSGSHPRKHAKAA